MGWKMTIYHLTQEETEEFSDLLTQSQLDSRCRPPPVTTSFLTYNANYSRNVPDGTWLVNLCAGVLDSRKPTSG